MSDRDDERERGEGAPDAPPSAEEALAAERLREALDAPDAATTAGDVALVAALRAAWSPRAIDPATHAALLEDLPTAEELALAPELRDALERAERGGAAGSPDAELAIALRSAFRPRDLAEHEHRARIEQALRPRADVVPLARARARRVGVAITTALAVAAGLVVWTTVAVRTAEQAPLARTRSTEELFHEPFSSGGASARIDRIALARASDYRDNRFAEWGVR